jgi:hypothetical protein
VTEAREVTELTAGETWLVKDFGVKLLKPRKDLVPLADRRRLDAFFTFIESLINCFA